MEHNLSSAKLKRNIGFTATTKCPKCGKEAQKEWLNEVVLHFFSFANWIQNSFIIIIFLRREDKGVGNKVRQQYRNII